MTDESRIWADDDPRRDIDPVAEAADTDDGVAAAEPTTVPASASPQHEAAVPDPESPHEATGGAHVRVPPAVPVPRPGTRGMGHVAEPDHVDPNDWWQAWLSRTGVTLLATLVLTTGLVWAWLGGLTNPHARSIPIAVISGDTNAIAALSLDQENSELQVMRYSSAAAATSALSKRQVAAILTSDQTGAAALNLTIASAAGPGVANSVVDSINSVATSFNVPLTIEDAYPTSEKDPDGRTPFYLMLVWIFGGLIAAVLIGVTLGTVPRDLDRLGMRLAALAVFSLALGLIGSLFAVPFLGIWNHHMFGLWMSGTLIVFTAALITSALQSWLGMWGIGIAALLLLVLGVPGAGGQWGSPLVPGFFRSMHSWVPNGLGTDLVRGVEYFGRNANTWPITGLALWCLAAIVALVGSTAVLGRQARSNLFDAGSAEPVDPHPAGAHSVDAHSAATP